MSNTWGGTDQALIAQAGFEAFKAAIAPLNSFTTDFSSEAMAKSASVSTRVITGMSAGAFSGSYISGDTTTTVKTVTLNQHSFRAFHQTDVEGGKTPVNVMLAQAAEASYAVGAAIFDYVTGLIVAATYGDTAADKVTVAIASFDADDVADGAKLMDDKDIPETNRSLILGNGYMASLRKDNALQVASAYGGSEVIREGSVGRLLGHDVYRTNAFSSTFTGENSQGIGAHPSAMAVAIRPVVPQDEGSQLIAFQTPTDPASGLTLGYRAWYDPNTGIKWGSFEALYGATPAQTTGLIRYVTA